MKIVPKGGSMIKLIPKGWGCELLLLRSQHYAAKLLIVFPGYESSSHYHRHKHETFFPLTEGFQLWKCRNEKCLRPKPFEAVVMRTRTLHRFTAIGQPCIVLEVSTGTSQTHQDCVRIEAGSSQTTPPEDWPRLGGLAGDPVRVLSVLFESLRGALFDIVKTVAISPGPDEGPQ